MTQAQMEPQEGLLAGHRVLDLSDEQGIFCGRLLGDLGAEVIAVEPPGGSPCRHIGPYYKDMPEPEKSLFWFANALNKKSITLDLETDDGKSLIKELVAQSDVIVDSFGPGYLEQRGLGHQALSSLNPRLVIVSITPFGEEGPYRDFKGSDLVHWALGGMLHLSGDADLPPVRVSFPQSYLHAGSQAAVGTILALYYRDLTGEGQVVDVAVHDCIPPCTLDALVYWDQLGFEMERSGVFRRRFTPKGVIDTRLVFPCADGHVVNAIIGGQMGEAANRELSDWMATEGIDMAALSSTGWPLLDLARITPQEMYTVIDAISAFTAKHNKAELYQAVFDRAPNIMLVPVSSPADLWDDQQLRAREFWQPVEHDELGTQVTYPGPWARVENGPRVGDWRRAPLVGEHNAEVYGGLLGLSLEELMRLRRAGAI